MNIFDLYFSAKNNINKRFGIFSNTDIRYNQASYINDYSKVAAVMTSIKILAENKARIKVDIKKDGEKESHYLNRILNKKPNRFQNANKFWTEIEYNRNYYGNSFAKIIRNQATGKVKELISIHPNSVEGYKIVNNQIYLRINTGTKSESINYDNILHFTTPLYQEGSIFTLSPLKSVINSSSIISKASDTINSFYSNNAVSPLVLSSEMPDNNQIKVLKEYTDEFAEKHSGPSNAGGIIALPPGMNLKPLSTSFVDAQLIDTMKFSRAEIASIFGVPL
ncbi:MAG: phage portal protein, partial [bacterium]